MVVMTGPRSVPGVIGVEMVHVTQSQARWGRAGCDGSSPPTQTLREGGPLARSLL